MTAGKRRIVRMLCKAVLLVSLPLAGYVWALPENSNMLLGAGVLTLLSLIVGFGAEVLASATESDLNELGERITVETQRRADELEIRDEKLRQFDRMVSLLTQQNHDLRASLIAVQVDLQRRRAALVEANEQDAGMDDVSQPLRPSYSARAH
ncbi:hypothetical protein [Aestuariivirga sp.]|uniref:hypothetical protein n=1 Tax=Aestuariivirga sp. TaxID=2650926 RepID=UPI003018700E